MEESGQVQATKECVKIFLDKERARKYLDIMKNEYY